MGQYVTCSVGDAHFALSIAHVREIINICPITPAPRAPRYLSGLINLRGQIVTVINLAGYMGSGFKTDHAQGFIIVLRTGGEGPGHALQTTDGRIIHAEPLGVLVDEIGDVLDVPRDGIDPPPANMALNKSNAVEGVVRTKTKLYAVLNVAEIVVSEVQSAESA